MRRSISNKPFYYIALLLLISMSCKAKRGIITTSVPARDPANTGPTSGILSGTADKAFADSLHAKQLDFKTLSVKAKAAVTIGQKENNVTLSIRMKKDEAIWMAVTGFGGIEGARALITPDSVKLLDKLNNVYLKKKFSFIHEYTSEEMTFNMLQAIITGNSNAFPGGKMTALDKGYELSGSLKNLVYKLILGPDLKLARTRLADPAARQELTVDYAGYSAKGEKELPLTVAIRSVAENSIAVDMEYSKPVFDQPVEMPFTVPKRFEVIE